MRKSLTPSLPPLPPPFTLFPQAVSKALRSAHEEGVNDRLCIVCCDAPACVVLLPCGHSQLCSNCADAHAAKAPFSCPTCRKVVTQKQRTFF